MSGDDEEILVARLVAGDEEAFRCLYNVYSPRIYSLGMHLTRSAVLAEELVQDVFEKLWTKRAGLEGVANLGAYIKAMVRNTASSHLKRMAHERLILGKIALGAASQEDTANNTIDQDQLRRIWQESVELLSPRVRQVYLLSRVEGLKNAEIANKLGISVYTVKEYLKNALSVIRTQLNGRLDLLVAAAIFYFF